MIYDLFRCVLFGLQVGAATGATLLIGIIQILMSLFHLGTIASFMSASFLNGFTAAAACHIVTSQVPAMLGIALSNHSQPFKFFYLWFELFSNLPHAKAPDVIISLICLVTLFIMKELINNNEKIKSKMKIPIPAELIIVIIAVLASYFAEFNTRYGVAIIHKVPRGFPAPAVPPMENFQIFLLDSIMMSFVCFVISFSMANMFSRKNNYEIDTNQELFAYGMCHAVGSFFFSFVGAAAPPRCAVLHSSGGKSQVSSIFSLLVLLLVLVAIGPLFEPLPKCVLAAIVCMALLPMFKQIREVKMFWKINKWDFITWVVTFVSVICLGLSSGLLIGIGFSVLTIALQAFKSKGFSLGNAHNSELYTPIDSHELAREVDGFKVFRFESGLHFASRDRFKQQLYKTTLNPQEIKIRQKKQGKLAAQESKEKDMKNGNVVHTVNGHVHDSNEMIGSKNSKGMNINDSVSSSSSSKRKSDMTIALTSDIHTVVIDCSSMTYMDIMGLQTLNQVFMEYHSIDVTTKLTNCSVGMLRTLDNAGVTSQCMIYPTVHDAITMGSNSATSKLMQTNGDAHSLPEGTTQNGVSNGLPGDTSQNGVSNGLSGGTTQNGVSNGLSGGTTQNGVSNGLPGDTSQNGVSNDPPVIL